MTESRQIPTHSLVSSGLVVGLIGGLGGKVDREGGNGNPRLKIDIVLAIAFLFTLVRHLRGHIKACLQPPESYERGALSRTSLLLLLALLLM